MALDPVTGGLIVGGGALLANMISGIVGRKERREQMNIERERQDTAYQRSATDMEAAGLSKTLAAGSPSPTQAMAPLDNPLGEIDPAVMMDLARKKKEIETMDKGIAKTNADIKIADQTLDNLRASYGKTLAETDAIDTGRAIQVDDWQKSGPRRYKDNTPEAMQYIAEVANLLGVRRGDFQGSIKDALGNLPRAHLTGNPLSAVGTNFQNWRENQSQKRDTRRQAEEAIQDNMGTWQANDRNRNMLPYYK